MKLVRFEPVRSLDQLTDTMNHIFEALPTFSDMGFSNSFAQADIAEDDKQFIVTIELPGVKKEDVAIKITEGEVLTVSGKKERLHQGAEQEQKYLRIERSHGKFSRSFTLPNINPEAVQATFEHGVLTITLGKVEPQQPKEIAISIA
jgi:HSP20 family protein